MFNIGMMELVLILLVAFLIVGPKDLPKVARWLARQIRSIRKLVDGLKDELGWDELTADVKETKAQVESAFSDADVSRELKDAVNELHSAAAGLKADAQKTAADVDRALKEE